MNETVIVREAGPPDLEAIISLWLDLQKYNAALDPRLTASDGAEAWFRDYLREQLENERAAVFVALLDNAVVGYIFGQILRRPTLDETECGYVGDLCITEEYRQRGIGTELYERLQKWFVDKEITVLEVQVIRSNLIGDAFWSSLGFNDFVYTKRVEL